MNNVETLAHDLKALHLRDGKKPVADIVIEKVVTAYALYGNDEFTTVCDIVLIFRDIRSNFDSIISINSNSPELIIDFDELMKRSETESITVKDFIKYFRPVDSWIT